MSLNSVVNRKKNNLSNFIKPHLRPWYGKLLEPATKILLETTTIAQEYGEDYPKYRLFPSETIATPEVKGMPSFDEPFKYLERDYYATPDIFTTILEGVLFEPGNGVVLTPSRKIITESLYPHMDTITFTGALLNRDFVLKRLFEKPIKVIPGYSSIYQGLPNGYYHRLVDLIPRCYLLNQPEYNDFEEIKLLYTKPLSEAESLIIPKIIPDNVKRTCLVPGKLYYLEKLILPTYLTQFGSGYLPAAYLQRLRKKLLPKRAAKQKNRIYISRAMSANSLKKRHILNEEELIEVLNEFGFQSYNLEEYSLSEKIELFYDAEVVVGAYGGGLTHILFSKNIKVLELQLMAKTQPYYYYLTKALGHPFYYLCSNKLNNRENFSVDTQKIREILQELL